VTVDVMCRGGEDSYGRLGPPGPISTCEFAGPVSVWELAHMLRDVDISSVVPDSSLVFTQKRGGCVSLRTRMPGAHGAYTEIRLVDTTAGSQWPFIPEDRPEIVCVNAQMCATWGLNARGICGVSVCKGGCAGGQSPVLRTAQQHVMRHLQRAARSPERERLWCAV